MATNNANNQSNPVAFSQGGTGGALTASNGAVVYSNATGSALLAPTSTANQFLLSGASSAPSWSTATYPSTVTANDLLYGSSSNVVGNFASAASSILTTTSGSALQWSSSLPSSAGGSLKLISTGTATGVSSITFTSLTSYVNYVLFLQSFYPATTNGTLICRVSTNNGSSYLTSGYTANLNSNLYNSSSLSNANFTNLFRISNGQPNSSSNTCNAVLYMYNLNLSTYFMLNGISTFYNLTPAVNTSASLSGFCTTNVNAFEIYYSSGNIASGTYSLYGVSTS
jgi:hypothetical protein